MKYIRICGNCGQTLHKKKVKGKEWGGSDCGYFTWLHKDGDTFTTCPKLGDVVVHK